MANVNNPTDVILKNDDFPPLMVTSLSDEPLTFISGWDELENPKWYSPAKVNAELIAYSTPNNANAPKFVPATT